MALRRARYGNISVFTKHVTPVTTGVLTAESGVHQRGFVIMS
jgi:hypothetical protein